MRGQSMISLRNQPETLDGLLLQKIQSNTWIANRLFFMEKRSVSILVSLIKE